MRVVLKQKQDLLESIENKCIKYRNIQLLKPKKSYGYPDRIYRNNIY
jgi:hypothetical protein